MPAIITDTPLSAGPRYATKVSMASGEMSGPIYLDGPGGASITAVPGAGCTIRVFKSSSSPDDIKADLLNGSLIAAATDIGLSSAQLDDLFRLADTL